PSPLAPEASTVPCAKNVARCSAAAAGIGTEIEAKPVASNATNIVASGAAYTWQPGAPNEPRSNGSSGWANAMRLLRPSHSRPPPFVGPLCSCTANAALPRKGGPLVATPGAAKPGALHDAPNGATPAPVFNQTSGGPLVVTAARSGKVSPFTS